MAELPKPPSDRTLEQDVPELKEFLRPGARVLDIGCGSGTITLDVARAVYPGRVIGLDPGADRIKAAREWLGQQTIVANVSFQVGDSHALDFADETFDVVYSHTVAHFFLDPHAALREQARVAKPGGWVAISGLREWVYSVRNPPCPNWDRYMDARRRHSEALLKAFQRSGLSPMEYATQKMADNPTYMHYMDPQAGKKCAGWLVEAGLTDLRVRVKAERLQYRGSPYMEPNTIWDVLPVDSPEKPMEREIALTAQMMIADGLLDSATLERAKREINAWYESPEAFFFNILVFGAARKPA